MSDDRTLLLRHLDALENDRRPRGPLEWYRWKIEILKARRVVEWDDLRRDGIVELRKVNQRQAVMAWGAMWLAGIGSSFLIAGSMPVLERVFGATLALGIVAGLGFFGMELVVQRRWKMHEKEYFSSLAALRLSAALPNQQSASPDASAGSLPSSR